MKAELAARARAAESGPELATENPAQYLDWKEEGVTGFYPARVIGRPSAGRDYTMDVRGMFQFLIPGVQHTEETDFRAKMFGIASYFQKRLGAGTEQQAVDNLLVL